MDRKRPASERAGGSAAVDGATPQGGAATPMERFKGLTRRLLGVSREQLAEEQRKYEQRKAKPAKRKD